MYTKAGGRGGCMNPPTFNFQYSFPLAAKKHSVDQWDSQGSLILNSAHTKQHSNSLTLRYWVAACESVPIKVEFSLSPHVQGRVPSSIEWTCMIHLMVSFPCLSEWDSYIQTIVEQLFNKYQIFRWRNFCACRVSCTAVALTCSGYRWIPGHRLAEWPCAHPCPGSSQAHTLERGSAL